MAIESGDLPRGSSFLELSAFVHARGLALVRFAVAVCGDAALAEDLVQESLAKVVRRFGDRISVDRPEAYVRQVIVREFLQWTRRRSATTTVAHVPELADDGAMVEPDQREVMWRFLAVLPRRQRVVLVLGFYEDLPDDEIAAVMGCTVGTVRSQRLRALRKLKEHPDLSHVATAAGRGGEERHD